MKMFGKDGFVFSMIKKYRELITYVICGVLTTVVTFVVYTPLKSVLAKPLGSISVQVADIVSWIAAVIFAFFVNKIFVFRDNVKSDGADSADKRTVVQFFTFASLRVASLGMELAIHFIFTNLLHQNDLIVKIFAQIFVVISNYIFSKFIIFKKKKEN